MNGPSDDHSTMFQLEDHAVRIWIEQEAIHLIAVDGTDPVELTADTARTLSAILIKLADTISDAEGA